MSNIKARSNRILIAGDHNLVVFNPLWGKGAKLRLWAERGLVHWEDERTDGGYGTMSWDEAAERILALSEMVFKSSEEPLWQKERQELQEKISQMEHVIRKAKEQGAPFSPKESLTARKSRRERFVRPQKLSKVIVGDDFLK